VGIRLRTFNWLKVHVVHPAISRVMEERAFRDARAFGNTGKRALASGYLASDRKQFHVVGVFEGLSPTDGVVSSGVQEQGDR